MKWSHLPSGCPPMDSCFNSACACVVIPNIPGTVVTCVSDVLVGTGSITSVFLCHDLIIRFSSACVISSPVFVIVTLFLCFFFSFFPYFSFPVCVFLRHESPRHFLTSRFASGFIYLLYTCPRLYVTDILPSLLTDLCQLSTITVHCPSFHADY